MVYRIDDILLLLLDPFFHRIPSCHHGKNACGDEHGNGKEPEIRGPRQSRGAVRILDGVIEPGGEGVAQGNGQKEDGHHNGLDAPGGLGIGKLQPRDGHQDLGTGQ